MSKFLSARLENLVNDLDLQPMQNNPLTEHPQLGKPLAYISKNNKLMFGATKLDHPLFRLPGDGQAGGASCDDLMRQMADYMVIANAQFGLDTSCTNSHPSNEIYSKGWNDALMSMSDAKYRLWATWNKPFDGMSLDAISTTVITKDGWFVSITEITGEGKVTEEMARAVLGGDLIKKKMGIV